jgi:hypothetical protein
MPPTSVWDVTWQQPLCTGVKEYHGEIMTIIYLHPIFVSKQDNIIQKAAAAI